MIQWINAARCTPPPGLPILFVTIDGDIELGKYTRILGVTCEIDKEHVYPWCDIYSNVRYKPEYITHWMRIPKVPEEK